MGVGIWYCQFGYILSGHRYSREPFSKPLMANFQVVLLFSVRINTQTSIGDQYRLSSPPPLQRA